MATIKTALAVSIFDANFSFIAGNFFIAKPAISKNVEVYKK